MHNNNLYTLLFLYVSSLAFGMEPDGSGLPSSPSSRVISPKHARRISRSSVGKDRLAFITNGTTSDSHSTIPSVRSIGSSLENSEKFDAKDAFQRGIQMMQNLDPDSIREMQQKMCSIIDEKSVPTSMKIMFWIEEHQNIIKHAGTNAFNASLAYPLSGIIQKLRQKYISPSKTLPPVLQSLCKPGDLMLAQLLVSTATHRNFIAGLKDTAVTTFLAYLKESAVCVADKCGFKDDFERVQNNPLVNWLVYSAAFAATRTACTAISDVKSEGN